VGEAHSSRTGRERGLSCCSHAGSEGRFQREESFQFGESVQCVSPKALSGASYIFLCLSENVSQGNYQLRRSVSLSVT